MTEQTYEDLVLSNGETRRDLDIVYGPIFRCIKGAFAIMFQNDGLKGSDFKRLSDMRFYQGGYPSPDTPPKEHMLAIQVANLIRLEYSTGKNTFVDFLETLGVRAETITPLDPLYTLSTEDEKKLVEAWEGAGIDKKLPTDKTEALKFLLDRSQNLQREINEVTDTIRVDGAGEAEAKHKISKGNFMKAVGLAAIKLKRGDGVMMEKLDDVQDSIDNLQLAIAPLAKR